jgi:hypothetical protein
MEGTGKRTGNVTPADRFNLNFERDGLFWVLEKLELAAYQLEADDAPIQERLQRALLEMHAVWPADLPHDLRAQLDPIRRAIVSLVMTTVEAEGVGHAILKLRGEVERRIEAR